MTNFGPHLLRSQIDGVAVNVLDTHTPSDEEWDAWVAEYRAGAAKWRGIVVYSLGGGPNTKQRSELGAAFNEIPVQPRACIVTSSVVMRGIATAVAWFLPPAAQKQMKIFPLNALEPALQWLELPPETRTKITQAILVHVKQFEAQSPKRRAQ